MSVLSFALKGLLLIFAENEDFVNIDMFRLLYNSETYEAHGLLKYTSHDVWSKGPSNKVLKAVMQLEVRFVFVLVQYFFLLVSTNKMNGFYDNGLAQQFDAFNHLSNWIKVAETECVQLAIDD